MTGDVSTPTTAMSATDKPADAATTTAPPITISNMSLGLMHKLIAAGTIWIPLLGTAAALIHAWQVGMDSIDITLLVVMFVLTNLGLEFGFHRNLAHRTFETSKAMQLFFAVTASMAGTGRVLFWVANHRRHHIHSDTPGDPHSPHVRMGRHGPEQLGFWRGMWHAHYGHILSAHTVNCTLFARDINQNPLLRKVNDLYLPLVVAGLLIPAAIGGLLKGTWMGAWEGLLWGGFVRMFLVHQATWGLASFSHRFGPSPFDTKDQSANNIWVALATFGSGWQNNHHAFPQSAYLGLKWWEIDMTAWVIAAFAKVGLVWNVRRPTAAQIEAKRIKPRIPDELTAHPPSR
ncbi:acyl-CoA desaturase [Chitinivorax sp. B]|uniref:acyl-CoA desaturase n=1 Tax=Chitinivorax sp. B TaxID=2502235 RepID=UPI0010F5C70B|nr:acyl-CoA desaturase [Chitinivorax sp. B]